MATSASNAFSGSGEDAIGRQIEVEADTTADHLNSHQEFENYYEIDRTVDQIVKGGYQRVSQSNWNEFYSNNISRLPSNFQMNCCTTPSPSSDPSKPKSETIVNYTS